MEIREYAEELLFGTALSAKLLRPDELSDLHPGKPLGKIPRAPGRPRELRFRAKSEREALSTQHSLRDLERSENRGALLHHFANHEILAVELMALALLLFPDAPADFRRSLVGSIAEEQKHFRMYRKRMLAMGCDFGDVPVNDFFWKHLAYPNTMRAPIDFAVRMGMTFEQANLDYMQHYAQVFRRLGDLRTVAVLEIVLRDEIGHVQNGVRWFEHYRALQDSPQDRASQWTDYVAQLPAELDPVRARGIGFDTGARQQAGLSDEYIQALRLHSYSRGRPPTLFAFNPLCEAAAAHYVLKSPGSAVALADAMAAFATGIPDRLHELATDLESVLLFLSRNEDAVLLRETPRAEFLSELQQAGFALPEIYAGPAGEASLAQRKLSDVRPWGVAPDSLEHLRFAFDGVVGSRGEELRRGGEAYYQQHAALYSRELSLQFAREFRLSEGYPESPLLALSAAESPATQTEPKADLKQSESEGDFCREYSELVHSLSRLSAAGHGRAVVKAAYSTAGRQRIRVGLPLNEADRTGLARFWEREHGAALGMRVEPWLERAADFSVQFSVLDDGQVKIGGAVRLFNSEAGGFRGCLTGRLFDGLDVTARRALADPRRGALPVLFAAAEFVGRQLAERGFRGAAGLDAFAWQGSRGLMLRPIVEVNPRFTMGRVALELGRRVRRHRAALWLHMPAQRLHDGKLFQNLAAACPLRYCDGLIDAGLLFTGDPERARQRGHFLLVGADLAQCRQILTDHGLGDLC